MIWLAACDLVAVDPGLDPLRLEVSQAKVTTDQRGRATVSFDVPPGAASFQLTGESDEYLLVQDLTDPSGRTALDWVDWIYNPRGLTLAFFPMRTTVALNWPIRAVDGTLEPGRWSATLAATDADYYYVPNADLTVTSTVKFDPSFADGVVSVQVVYARRVDSDPAVVSAVEGAVGRWAEVWAQQGAVLAVEYTSSDIPANLGFAYTGSADVAALARQKDPEQLQLVVGETILGDAYTFGVSAGIPGTLEATPDTFVVVAWLTHAGADGVFDADEIRLMGETMAHEVGHYTGLLHPVEAYYDAWDALDDTPECGTAGSCEAQLGSNLMFPYPICSFASCAPQGDLTPDQGGVMQRYVGAL